MIGDLDPYNPTPDNHNLCLILHDSLRNVSKDTSTHVYRLCMCTCSRVYLFTSSPHPLTRPGTLPSPFSRQPDPSVPQPSPKSRNRLWRPSPEWRPTIPSPHQT